VFGIWQTILKKSKNLLEPVYKKHTDISVSLKKIYDEHKIHICKFFYDITRPKHRDEEPVAGRGASTATLCDKCDAGGDLPIQLIQRDADARSCSLILALIHLRSLCSGSLHITSLFSRG